MTFTSIPVADMTGEDGDAGCKTAIRPADTLELTLLADTKVDQSQLLELDGKARSLRE